MIIDAEGGCGNDCFAGQVHRTLATKHRDEGGVRLAPSGYVTSRDAIRKIASESIDESFARGRIKRAFNGCGKVLDRLRKGTDIQTDAHNDEVARCRQINVLAQDAGEFASSKKKVVGPLQ